MNDILVLQERVKNSILVGESDFREFKSAWEGKPGNKKPIPIVKHLCQYIAEALVAFANSDGGELIIGVEDDGSVTGVPHAEEEIQAMLNAPSSHVFINQQLPLIYNLKMEISGQTVLFFQVDKGSSEVYQLRDGRVMVRKQKRTVPGSSTRLQFERQEIRSREYDRQFVDGATINDLDILQVQSLAERYIKDLTPEKFLQQMGLAEYSVSGLKLRNAALLLFAKDIQKWHPRSQVRYLKVAGTTLLSGDQYNVISDEFVQGNIFELLIKGWEGLRPYLAYKTEFGPDAKFEQRYIYPEGACREALLNAVAHRDYSSYNGIEVLIFDDRLEIKSPGALLSTLTITDLYALENRHESRNVKITYVLKVTEFMREIGEGMKRIFQLMEKIDRQRPLLYSNTNWFAVTFFNISIFSPRQEAFLNEFKYFNLTENQQKIVLLGIDGAEIAQEDIYRAMNSSDRDTYDREVTGLRKMGLLHETRTNPQTGKISELTGIPKRKIARFKVSKPK
ncbi:MAG: ATP-binding protein [Saprospiraceae bacterium]